MTCRNCSGVSRVAGHGGADAGVVDEDVDPAELGHRRVDQGWCSPRGRRRRSPRVSARRPAPRTSAGGLLEPVDPPGAERHVGARLGERLGERHAEAAARRR